ncbi:hypothetical protein [Lysobacter gummosus]|uniref:hypothetical protein n=1 Tax=Lysobacter gummosus TaxID=262324 RepID=UPI00363C3869
MAACPDSPTATASCTRCNRTFVAWPNAAATPATPRCMTTATTTTPTATWRRSVTGERVHAATAP